MWMWLIFIKKIFKKPFNNKKTWIFDKIIIKLIIKFIIIKLIKLIIKLIIIKLIIIIIKSIIKWNIIKL